MSNVFMALAITASVGSWGIVYQARCKRTRRIVAVKDIKTVRDDPGYHKDSLREIEILKQIPSHPNVVKLLDVVLNSKKFLLVFEYVSMDLKKFIGNYGLGKLIAMDVIKSFMYQLLSGLSYCHKNRVIHRDLKPQNILVKHNTIVKLADFGLARIADIQQPIISGFGTLWFRSPEILLGAPMCSFPNDVWSMGCIMGELITKQTLFKGDSRIGQLHSIFKVMRTPTEDTWPGVRKFRNFKSTFPKWVHCVLLDRVERLKDEPEGIDLLEKLLQLFPVQRINADEACQHPFFNGIF